MGLVNAAKDVFEEYRQRYLGDGRKFSYGGKSLAGKNANGLAHALYQPYKWLFVFPVLVIATFVMGSLAVIVAILFSPRTGSLCGALWARINSFVTPMTVTIKGAENIEPGTSYVVTANHQSLYDIYVIYGWLGIDFKWVMKKELEKVPVLGFACKVLGHIFVDRSDSKKAVETINAAKTKIVNGTSVLFFPEGSRSSDGVMKPFKKGAFKMALDLGLPVLPVTINGTRRVLPKGGIDLRPGNVTLILHQPIAIKDYSEETMGDLMDRTRMVHERFSGLNPPSLACPVAADRRASVKLLFRAVSTILD